MTISSDIHNLVKRDGQRCHYCNVITRISRPGPKRATRDHVVPKSFGGANKVENYVLACSQCNEIRGNTLVYCACEFCETVIDNWFMDNVWSFNNFGRFRIFNDLGRWAVVFNGKRTHHKSHFAAVRSMAGIGRSHYLAAEGMRNLL